MCCDDEFAIHQFWNFTANFVHEKQQGSLWGNFGFYGHCSAIWLA